MVERVREWVLQKGGEVVRARGVESERSGVGRSLLLFLLCGRVREVVVYSSSSSAVAAAALIAVGLEGGEAMHRLCPGRKVADCQRKRCVSRADGHVGVKSGPDGISVCRCTLEDGMRGGGSWAEMSR